MRDRDRSLSVVRATVLQRKLRSTSYSCDNGGGYAMQVLSVPVQSHVCLFLYVNEESVTGAGADLSDASHRGRRAAVTNAGDREGDRDCTGTVFPKASEC